jgi:hypothetical protein
MEELEEIVINTEEDELTVLGDNRTEIHLRLISSIEKSIEENIESIDILKIVNNYRGYIMILKVEKKNWKDSLLKSLSYFEEVQEYEVCSKIKKTLEKLK